MTQENRIPFFEAYPDKKIEEIVEMMGEMTPDEKRVLGSELSPYIHELYVESRWQQRYGEVADKLGFKRTAIMYRQTADNLYKLYNLVEEGLVDQSSQ